MEYSLNDEQVKLVKQFDQLLAALAKHIEAYIPDLYHHFKVSELLGADPITQLRWLAQEGMFGPNNLVGLKFWIERDNKPVIVEIFRFFTRMWNENTDHPTVPQPVLDMLMQCRLPQESLHEISLSVLPFALAKIPSNAVVLSNVARCLLINDAPHVLRITGLFDSPRQLLVEAIELSQSDASPICYLLQHFPQLDAITLSNGIALSRQQLLLRAITIEPGNVIAGAMLASHLPTGESITLPDGTKKSKMDLCIQILSSDPSNAMAYHTLASEVTSPGVVTLADGTVMSACDLCLKSSELQPSKSEWNKSLDSIKAMLQTNTTNSIICGGQHMPPRHIYFTLLSQGYPRLLVDRCCRIQDPVIDQMATKVVSIVLVQPGFEVGSKLTFKVGSKKRSTKIQIPIEYSQLVIAGHKFSTTEQSRVLHLTCKIKSKLNPKKIFSAEFEPEGVNQRRLKLVSLKGSTNKAIVFAVFNSIESSASTRDYAPQNSFHWISDLLSFLNSPSPPLRTDHIVAAGVVGLLANRSNLSGHTATAQHVTSFAPFLQAVTRLVDNGTLTLNQLPFLRYPSDSLKINDQSKQECGPEAAVLSGSLTGTNAPVTVKMFSTGQGGDDSSLVIKLTNELVISMIVSIFSPYAITALGWSQVEMQPCLVSERLDVTLAQYLPRSQKAISLDSALRFGRAIAAALSTLHDLNLFHSNLNTSIVSIDIKTGSVMRCGVGGYEAVEPNATELTKAANIYALGMILQQVFENVPLNFGTSPPSSPRDDLQPPRSPTSQTSPVSLLAAAQEVISCCLKPEAANRPLARDVSSKLTELIGKLPAKGSQQRLTFL